MASQWRHNNLIEVKQWSGKLFETVRMRVPQKHTASDLIKQVMYNFVIL